MTDMPLASEIPEEVPTQVTDSEGDVELQSKNLAVDMDEETLRKLSDQCLSGFEADLASRVEWEQCLDDWIALAKQTREDKTFPWRGASNVKYPLITTAAMQFSARAYPSLIPANGKVVKVKVIGKDPTGAKFERSQRVGEFLSWQVMYDIPNWEEDMDKMLMQLPIVGTLFKKTSYDHALEKISSRLILPKNIVVNNWTTCLEDAERISEVFLLSKRKLQERVAAKLYLDEDLGDPQGPETDNDNPLNDETTPYEFVEQHTFFPIQGKKDNEYPHPVIVTFERTTGTVVRVSRRYLMEDIVEEDGDLIKIVPRQFYTKFGFIPNPDGSFYDIGFGVLLGPLNESVNTLINQMIDAGSLNNLQAGFISKTVKFRMGESKFTPGEWKPVNAGGDDIKKGVFPLPTKEPSNVLFQLMGSLITSGKELASVAEIFTGKMPGQNTPATTTMATVEQGMKVFTAVYKRIYRALEQEFKKIYKLNQTYMDPYTPSTVLDESFSPDDFSDKDYDICPGADPTAVSQSEKLMKAQGLLELIQMAPQAFNIVEVLSRVLEAQEQPNWQTVFSPEIQQSGQLPPPPPDPKVMAMQEKMKLDQQKASMDIQQKQMEMELDGRDKAMQMQMKQQEHAQKMQHQMQTTQVKAASDIAMANIFASTERQKGQQQIANGQAQHEQKMTQAKEQSKLQKTSKSGSKTK
jgi:chaperonin GroES